MNFLSRSFLRKRAISLATKMTVAGLSFAFAPAPMAASGSSGAFPVRNLENVIKAPFLAENDAAMTKMMTGITVKPTGDLDRDILKMTMRHRQGAVDMAQSMRRRGYNKQLRQSAQEIIVAQQKRIAAMRVAVEGQL